MQEAGLTQKTLTRLKPPKNKLFNHRCHVPCAGAWGGAIAAQLAAGPGSAASNEVLIQIGGGSLLTWVVRACRSHQDGRGQQEAERAVLLLLQQGEVAGSARPCFTAKFGTPPRTTEILGSLLLM